MHPFENSKVQTWLYQQSEPAQKHSPQGGSIGGNRLRTPEPDWPELTEDEKDRINLDNEKKFGV